MSPEECERLLAMEQRALNLFYEKAEANDPVCCNVTQSVVASAILGYDPDEDF